MPITQKQATQVIEEFKQWGAYREDRMVAAIDFVQNCTTLESFDSPKVYEDLLHYVFSALVVIKPQSKSGFASHHEIISHLVSNKLAALPQGLGKKRKILTKIFSPQLAQSNAQEKLESYILQSTMAIFANLMIPLRRQRCSSLENKPTQISLLQGYIHKCFTEAILPNDPDMESKISDVAKGIQNALLAVFGASNLEGNHSSQLRTIEPKELITPKEAASSLIAIAQKDPKFGNNKIRVGNIKAGLECTLSFTSALRLSKSNVQAAWFFANYERIMDAPIEKAGQLGRDWALHINTSLANCHRPLTRQILMEHERSSGSNIESLMQARDCFYEFFFNNLDSHLEVIEISHLCQALEIVKPEALKDLIDSKQKSRFLGCMVEIIGACRPGDEMAGYQRAVEKKWLIDGQDAKIIADFAQRMFDAQQHPEETLPVLESAQIIFTNRIARQATLESDTQKPNTNMTGCFQAPGSDPDLLHVVYV